MGDMTVLYAIIGALTGIVVGHVLANIATDMYIARDIKRRRKEHARSMAKAYGDESSQADGVLNFMPGLRMFDILTEKERAKNNDKAG